MVIVAEMFVMKKITLALFVLLKPFFISDLLCAKFQSFMVGYFLNDQVTQPAAQCFLGRKR